MSLESTFQAEVINDIEEMLPGCEILKNDSGYRQGIPDLIVLYRRRYALLEVKRKRSSRRQPNQEYYIEKFSKWSFAAFICPENKEDVLHDLQRTLRPVRTARSPQRK